MGQLIRDVIPPFEEFKEPRIRRRTSAKRIKTEAMVSELHRRGVTIKDIFGQYYALEEMASAKDDKIFGSDEEGQHGSILTVGDVQLAGISQLPSAPLERQPF